MFGLLGPNGAGKTTTVEILEGYRRPRRGDGRGARRATRSRRAARWRERIGVVLQSSAMYPNLTVAREPRALRRLLRAAARRRRGDRARRPRREARARVRDALGRPEAAARPRARPDRRSRAPLPRRADDRLRPRSAPRSLGHDPLAALARQDDPPHHALPRRGGAARRPRRRPAGGTDRRARQAGGAQRRGAGYRDPLPPRRRGGRHLHARADARPARADRAGARRGPRARGARACGGRRSRSLPRADRRDDK